MSVCETVQGEFNAGIGWQVKGTVRPGGTLTLRLIPPIELERVRILATIGNGVVLRSAKLNNLEVGLGSFKVNGLPTVTAFFVNESERDQECQLALVGEQ